MSRDAARPVSEVMTRYVEFIAPDASVQEAATMMGELDVGSLPVGTPERIEGVITDRDVLFRVVAAGLASAAVPVSEVMSRPVVSCGETDPLRVAMDLMASHHVRRLPVLDGRGEVTGWITLADLSRTLLLESGTLQGALQALDAGG